MIQAINSVNTNSYKKQNASFKQQPQQVELDLPEVPKKKPSKAAAWGRYLGTQFVAGAIFSSIWDGATNIFRAIRKTKPVIPAKEVITRAGIVGGMFALIGVVFAAIDVAIAKKKAKEQ